MGDFAGLPRTVLLAISALSGDRYDDVDGNELLAELERRGRPTDEVTLRNLMAVLRGDDFVQFTSPGGMSVPTSIRLDTRGRQEVENWPKAAGIGAADVEALLRLLEARSADPDVPNAERSKARAAVDALRGLGDQVIADVMSAWLRSQAGLP